jgi:acyl carrier protein
VRKEQALEIMATLARILERENVTPETLLPKPHLDSLSRVELSASIEDVFGIEMNDDALLKSFKSVGDVLTYCESIQ